MKYKVTLLEECLGTTSGNPDIQSEFISSKAPDADTRDEEIAIYGADFVVEKTKTIFPKENGKPFLWDYQMKGFIKDACSMLARVPGTRANGIKAFRKVIDGLIFVNPRKIFLNLPENTKIGECQRPLRASTPQGERIALANSETVPVGTWFDCEIVCLDPRHEKLIEELMEYGKLRGLLQWRNSGKGRFEAVLQ